MSSPGEDDKNGKGFVGLSGLISARSADDEGKAEASASSSRPEPEVPELPAAWQSTGNARAPLEEPRSQTGAGWRGAWVALAVLGALFVGGVIIGMSDRGPATSPAATHSRPAPSLVSSRPAAPSSPVQAPPPSRPQESKPPVGRDLVFSMAQIRYCLAEEIRMDSAKSALDNYSDRDVDRFNAMVADYNSRCGSFRYRSGALGSARRDVESYRSQFQAEGRSRFARSSSTGARSTPAPSRPAPDLTIQAIQRNLNRLGYSAGPADGLMGRDTRSAIIAFQQDRGLTMTGVADQALLSQLERAPRGSPDNVSEPVMHGLPSQNSPAATQSIPPSPGLERSGPPANSWVSGSSWYCNSGYRKVGERCEKLNVPSNAWVSGSNWYCNNGFRRSGDQCLPLDIPDNAWVSGSNWYCNNGYRKVDERCEKLNVPANAWVSGSNWYCNTGFRRVGDECVALDVPSNAWVSGSNWYCNSGYRRVGDQCVSVYER